MHWHFVFGTRSKCKTLTQKPLLHCLYAKCKMSIGVQCTKCQSNANTTRIFCTKLKNFSLSEFQQSQPIGCTFLQTHCMQKFHFSLNRKFQCIENVATAVDCIGPKCSFFPHMKFLNSQASLITLKISFAQKFKIFLQCTHISVFPEIFSSKYNYNQMQNPMKQSKH